ncbi:zinc finger protein [Saccharopolyspora phatthalungensis]|uniref:Uncharacterized protein n=1 Tax=Saccharopolyspora phatthalungensis TaxID=664693 RepID=A0A840Q8K0_9PSEU|nr:zinc finger protein [Saccharopolyspora phatthalungensis]MBB5156776.1 hypothetical protein [Saccharopolyspora phatthalungensis]
MSYQPHPFSWAPAGGLRHASTDTRPRKGYPTGFVVATLCGYQLAAENTTLAWLWDKCPACNDKVHGRANTPTPHAVGAK